MTERMAAETRGAFGGPGGLTATPVPFGTAVGWWEKPSTGNWNRWRGDHEGFEIRYPKTKHEREREIASTRGCRGILKREGLKLPRTIDPEDANRSELLVPIRIDFDVGHHKMRDTLVWNLNDPIVTPEIFAQSLVEDYAIAPTYRSVIVKSIQDQLSDYKAHHLGFDLDSRSMVHIQGENICGKLEAGDSKWWNGWRRKMCQRQPEGEDEDEDKDEGRTGRIRARVKAEVVKEVEEDGDVVMHDQGHEDYRSMGVDELMVDEGTMHEDMRISIKLSIIVPPIKLNDQFEWDLGNPSASPEDFAEVYTQELGLGGEFKTAIAHSIREQVQTYRKSLFLVGHPSDGSPVQDDDLKQSFLSSLTSGVRPVGEAGMFTPLLEYLSDGELERAEKDRDKDLAKRRKRNARGRRGVALPDREPIRTYRTPATGFPDLDAATLGLGAAANAPLPRRAAAAAASLTIANIVALESRTVFTHTTMISATSSAEAQAREKKQKGLFKAALDPASVLRPRASVVTPTPSGAAGASAGSSSCVSFKAISAKRAKELQREGKEKEFVDGQHPNFVEGVWHCSNCGCPESIAIGRRKGPLGGGTQCGTCGKYWSRHRRPRPVEYNIDANFHSWLKLEETEYKALSSKNKGGAAALHSTTLSDTPALAGIGMQGVGSDAEAGGATMMAYHEMEDEDEDSGALSPVSMSLDTSEAPLVWNMEDRYVGSGSGCVGVVPLFPPKSEKKRHNNRKKDREREREVEKDRKKCTSPVDSTTAATIPMPSPGASPGPYMTPVNSMTQLISFANAQADGLKAPAATIREAQLPHGSFNQGQPPTTGPNITSVIETVNSMAELISFANAHALGPKDALKAFAVEIRAAQLLPVMGPDMTSVIETVSSMAELISFANAHALGPKDALKAFAEEMRAGQLPRGSFNQGQPPMMNDTMPNPISTSPSHSFPPYLPPSAVMGAAPGTLYPGGTTNAPSILNTSLKRKQAGDAALPTMANPDQPPIKRRRKRGQTVLGTAGAA